jgi:hypothetical protein
LDARRQTLLIAQQRYLESEGFQHRGNSFISLAMEISTIGYQTPTLSEFDVLALLGPPDLGGSDAGGMKYVYLCADGNGQAMAVYVRIAHDGHLGVIGLANASQDFAGMGMDRYARWPQIQRGQ